MNPQNATPAKRKKWPLWAKGLLVASLALNVLVMGLFAGHMLKKRDARVMGSQQLSWILKFVPEERRDFTKAHFKQFRGELRAARRAQRETMDRILDTIRTEPFSAEDLQAAMNARLETRSRRTQLIQDQLVVLLEQFTPEERAAFAESLAKRLDQAKTRRGQ